MTPICTAPIRTAPIRTAPIRTAPIRTVPIRTVPIRTVQILVVLLTLLGLAACGDDRTGPPATLDSGMLMDAGGARDGGMRMDAGMKTEMDAGMKMQDAGMEDDAGMNTDAGMDDAGMAGDAGMTDAGMTDAGMTDAGMTDAGMTDAGMVGDAGMPMCIVGSLGSMTGTAVVTGMNAGAGDDTAPPTGCASGASGGMDVAYTWTAPATGRYRATTAGSDYDTVLYVRAGASCTGTDVVCDDDGLGVAFLSQVNFDAAAGDVLTFIIDGYDSIDIGSYALDIETVSCPDTALGSAEGASVAAGTTVGAYNDYQASCGLSADSSDLAFTWTAPRAGSWTFDTFGSSYDTVLYILDGATCGGTELGCNDDSGAGLQSALTMTLTMGQTITIIVDGYNTGSEGPYVLNITGP